MRIILASILAATVASAATPAARAVRRVTGTVERAIHAQGPCRGGVAVTREEMDEVAAKTQHIPLSRTTFTIFAGRQHAGKPLLQFKTDRAARFDVSLPEGVFCVMAGAHGPAAPDNAPRAAPPRANVDAECLRERALACDAQLHVRRVDARDVKLTLDTFTPCPQPWAQPCYRGPAPP